MNNMAAILGGAPTFSHPIKQQNYLPEWDQFGKMIDGIFGRKYYTNHGPLAQGLEKRMAEFLNVKHTICMTNTGIGLMIAVKALGLKGKIIVPAFSHFATIQSLVWAGLEPVFCDVDENTLHYDIELLNRITDKNISAVLGINHFGGSDSCGEIADFADRNSIRHLYLSSDSIGQTFQSMHVGNFGSMELFSLHESNIINSTDGCLITTNDDFVAARLRNIRSSYGAGKTVPIEFTGNGRMSEVQAGMALLTLDNYDHNVKLNAAIIAAYERHLKKIEGVSVYAPGADVSSRNYQRLVIRIDEAEFGLNAGELVKALKAENIYAGEFSLYARQTFAPFAPLDSMPRAVNCASLLMELPVHNSAISENDVERITETIVQLRSQARMIKAQVK